MMSKEIDKMDLILAKLSNLDTKIDKIEKNLDLKIDKVEQNMVEHINGRMNTLENEILATKNLNIDLQQKFQEQETKITMLENKISNDLRRNNIIILNLGELKGSRSDIEREIVSKLEEQLEISITQQDINYVKFLGKNFTEPILISMASWRIKREILEKKRTLRDKQSNLIIKEDLPVEVRECRKKLSYYWEQKQKEGIKTYIKYDKLVVNGKMFTLEELERDEQAKKRGRDSEGDDSESNVQERKRANSLSGVNPQSKPNNLKNFLLRPQDKTTRAVTPTTPQPQPQSKKL